MLMETCIDSFGVQDNQKSNFVYEMMCWLTHFFLFFSDLCLFHLQNTEPLYQLRSGQQLPVLAWLQSIGACLILQFLTYDATKKPTMLG